MIQIHFEIDGRRIHPDDLGDGLQQSALKQFEEIVQSRVGYLYCPEHHKQPILLFRASNRDWSIEGVGFSLEVSGCCNNLIATTTATIQDYVNQSSRMAYEKNVEIHGEDAHRVKKRFECRSCKRETNQTLQYAHTVTVEMDEIDSRFVLLWNVWLVWQCNGCDSLTLQITEVPTDWFEGKPWPSDVHIDYDSFYPPTSWAHVGQTGTLVARQFNDVPPKILRLYSETIRAYNLEFDIFCAVGLRSLIESVCDDKKISKRHDSLQTKLDNLTKLGISQKIVDNLHAFRFMGNEAAHELTAPSRQKLSLAIEIIDQILSIVYELESKTRELIGDQGIS